MDFVVIYKYCLDVLVGLVYNICKDNVGNGAKTLQMGEKRV